MYTEMPITTKIVPEAIDDGQLNYRILLSSQEVPLKQREFLMELGWHHSCYHPDTGEELFCKTLPPDEYGSLPDDLCYNHWHWYEAVAYEFTKFMSVGDDDA